MSITIAQIRGARGILNWSQQDLAQRTGISATSIGSIENGVTTPRASTLEVIRHTFESSNIEFIGLDGVRQRTGDVRVLKGEEGFWNFYEELYKTLLDNPGEVLVSNVDERIFEKWLSKHRLDTHVQRMRAIKGLSYKILIKEGDTHFLATPDYCEYRWMPKDLFTSVPFYIFGNKLAVIIFEEEPTVIVLDYSAIADAYRKQFSSIWNISVVPDKDKKKA